MDIIIPYFFIYSFKVRKKRSFFLVDFVCVCVCVQKVETEAMYYKAICRPTYQ